ANLGASAVSGPAPPVPRWADVSAPAAPFADGDFNSEHRVVEYRGWPLPTMRAEVAAKPWPVIPLRPVPFGFALDTLIFAAAAGLLWWLMTWPARFVIESQRMRHGRCLRCGYELNYDFIAGCPECGWRR